MSIAGVDDDVAGPLVRAVSAPGAAAAPDEAAERFARAAWSHLAEPAPCAISGLGLTPETWWKWHIRGDPRPWRGSGFASS